MRAKALPLLVSAGLAASVVTATAATYQVGPGRAYTKPQDVVGLLNPGDVVQVDGNATYPGDLTFRRPGTAAQPILIQGIRVNGKRPVISGGTNTVHFRTDVIGEGADHYVFQGFEVTGGASRCIFHQSNDLILRDLAVHDCPKQGILGADWGSGSMLLEHSEVYRNGSGTGAHQIYMAIDEENHPDGVFRMRFNWVHDGLGGNNVKSRAARNEIYYNRIEGAYYHELELIGADPACCGEDVVREDSDVVGNLIIKRPPPYGPNPDFFATRVGGDGTGQSWGRYRFVNNTFVMGGIAVFRIFDGIESIEMHNNVFYRYGGQPVQITRTVEAVWKSGPQMSGSNNWMTTGSTQAPPAWTGTLTGTDPGFVNLAGNDFSPTAASPLLNAGNPNPTSANGFQFPNPHFPPAYHPPGVPGAFGVPNSRPADGLIDIGAYERGAAGQALLSIGDVSVTEGNSGSKAAVFTVTLSPATSSTVTVSVSTLNGTATAGSDYTAVSGTLTFAPFETSKTVSVPVLGDTVVEPNETFYVKLSGATNAGYARSQATGTIVNDDAPAATVSIRISDARVVEGNAGATRIAFSVTLSAPSTQAVSVMYSTANGTATAGRDYAAVTGSLTFAPGETSKVIATAVIGDTLVEPNETFYVNLSSAVGATIADGQGLGTIVNDDTARTPRTGAPPTLGTASVPRK